MPNPGMGTIDRQTFVDRLRSMSSHDWKQAEAQWETLMHVFSCIQGPPGAGKMYAMLLDLLLKEPYLLKEIIIVVQGYTNQSVDHLVEHLDPLFRGSIRRLGNQSRKPEEMGGFSIRSARAKYSNSLPKSSKELPFNKLVTVTNNGSDMTAAASKAVLLLDFLQNGEMSYEVVGDFLKDHYPKICGSFQTPEKNYHQSERHKQYAGMRPWVKERLRAAPLYLFLDWLQGKDFSEAILLERMLSAIKSEEDTPLFKNALQEEAIKAWENANSNNLSTIWDLSHQARINLAEGWFLSDKDDARKVAAIGTRVIACTASYSVMRPALISELGPIIFLINEAALWPYTAQMCQYRFGTVQQMLLTGDHAQLGPQGRGEGLMQAPFNNSISVFQDFFMDATSSKTTLDLEHRCPPPNLGVVKSVKSSDGLPPYPHLTAAASTHKYSELPGMESRLLWLDHRHPEGGGDDDGLTVQSDVVTASLHRDTHKSLSNAKEAEMVLDRADLAIITPYNGQLNLILRNVSKLRNIQLWLSDADREMLVASGSFDESEMEKLPISPFLTLETYPRGIGAHGILYPMRRPELGYKLA
ncbi:uncharacterized protein AB675_1710 [Cyphellophora attinorum]|uniref:DNA2/NAM7 helicase-like C-terminal domain-containing protein n=1 Tax=Cyphellophora attinorum TaxID=1664694 RepID=A0A0N1HDE9_9EURO|nr:uncharacterized protein AB675_1710 [Phialophora attinorum]KPI42653.1 hypothetical protein AB675_1710 [Phialophora attinorum]